MWESINLSSLRRHTHAVVIPGVLHRFYHGHVDSVRDIYAGQMGPLIIYKKGVLNSRGLPKASISFHAVPLKLQYGMYTTLYW